MPQRAEYSFERGVICVLGRCPEAIIALLNNAMPRSMRVGRELGDIDKNALTVIIGRMADIEGLAPPSVLVRAQIALQAGDEGFWVEDENRDGHCTIWIVADRIRGVTYGIGWLIQTVKQAANGGPWILMPEHHEFLPKYPIRGHHLGYRPISNTYDAWDIKDFERYIAELSIFGTNTIEWVPPHTPGHDISDLMPRSPNDMLSQVSQVVQDCDLDFSIWAPLMETDYDNDDVVSQQIQQWQSVLTACARVDHFFVPGGDPGNNSPGALFCVLQRFAPILHEHFPTARIWVSCQGWTRSELDDFILLANQQPTWLFGVVYGPWTRRPLDWLRQELHASIAIRTYPDLSHTFSCQFPVSNWDPAYAATEGREPINPMPAAHAAIAQTFLPETQGFISYSEGVNDDFNKILWTVLAWDPSKSVDEVVGSYVRAFISRSAEAAWSRLIMDLEANWNGPVTANAGIERALSHLQFLWQSGGETVQCNWRVQQLAYRAHYDAWVRARAMTEGAVADRIQDALVQAGPVQSRIEAAYQIAIEPPSRRALLYESLQALGQRLRSSVGMQLSIRYGASEALRGANLDTLDMPVSHYDFLRNELRLLRDLSGQPREIQLGKIIEWLAGSADDVIVDFGSSVPCLGTEGHSADLLEGVGQSLLPSWLVDSEAMGNYRAWPYGLEYGVETRGYKMQYRIHGLLTDTAYQLKVFYWGEYQALVRLRIHGHVAHEPTGISTAPVVVHVPADWINGDKMTLEWELVEDSTKHLENGIQVAQIRYRPLSHGFPG